METATPRAYVRHDRAFWKKHVDAWRQSETTLGAAWTNMAQPFWALPLLGIAGLGIRDIMGYCIVALMWSGLVFWFNFVIPTKIFILFCAKCCSSLGDLRRGLV